MEHTSLFNERHSAAIRIWHWIFFIVISASITMVILASTVFATRDNAGLVQSAVTERGGTVTEEQARGVSHEFNDLLWNMHKYLGYGLAFLLLARIIIEFAHSGEERLGNKIRNAVKMQRPGKKEYLWAKYGYLVFYVLILVMALTGLVLAFEDISFFRQIRRPVKEVHEDLQWAIYAYILLHLAGVIRADLTHSKGIVSGMINGNRS